MLLNALEAFTHEPLYASGGCAGQLTGVTQALPAVSEQCGEG